MKAQVISHKPCGDLRKSTRFDNGFMQIVECVGDDGTKARVLLHFLDLGQAQIRSVETWVKSPCLLVNTKDDGFEHFQLVPAVGKKPVADTITAVNGKACFTLKGPQATPQMKQSSRLPTYPRY